MAMYSSLLQGGRRALPRFVKLSVVAKDHEQRLKMHAEWLEHHNRAIAEHDEILAESARARAEHERKMELLDARIRRLIKLAVQEARAERRKRREMDDKITQLSSSHLLTEEALRDLKATVDAFIASLRRGANGNPQS